MAIPDTVLPLDVAVPLSLVQQSFPEVNRTAITGPNLTALGNPIATRSVIYANSDSSRLVTVTVDEYASTADASAAFQLAILASQVPGVIEIPIPVIGQQSFAGTVTQNGEPHVGLGWLDATLVLGVTLAGYNPNVASNISGLVGVSQTEDRTAKTALGIPICFAAGTRIATPGGLRPVESLRVGETVLTLSGAAKKIRWIGQRRIDCRRHAKKDRVMPIRIVPHAFGEGRPGGYLLLSPDHSVFVEGVLVPIKFLVNDDTIEQVQVEAITYYHIELPKHDVVLAEGLPVETYLDTGGGAAFDNEGAIQLHPDFAPSERQVAMLWQNFGFAPLLGDEALLEQVRARLHLQAELLRQSQVAPPSQPMVRRGG